MLAFSLFSCGGADDFKNIAISDYFLRDQLVINLAVKKTTYNPSEMSFSEADLATHKGLVDAKNDDKTTYVTKLYDDRLFIQRTTQYITNVKATDFKNGLPVEKVEQPITSYYIIFKCASNSSKKFYITSVAFPYHLLPDITCEFYLDKAFAYDKPYTITSKSEFVDFYKNLQGKAFEQVYNESTQKTEDTPFVGEITENYIITYGARRNAPSSSQQNKPTKIEFSEDGKSITLRAI